MDQETCMKKYPRLVAHMICQSLGYFTPKSAANAIARYKENLPYFCEWYSHMGQFRNDRKDLFDDASVLAVGKDTIRASFQLRHTHRGYMADYDTAINLVTLSINKKHDPVFASWF